jgi:methylenetetrahydrofolate--tRNA-(uracil-5-)-methyltransferase
MLAGLEKARALLGEPPADFSAETAIGALALYISGGAAGKFQPMNVNFGIITPLGHKVRGKQNKNLELADRSLAILGEFIRGGTE